MKDFNSLSEAMNALREEGYVLDFNLKHNCIDCNNGQDILLDSEFEVDSFYRFEGMSDPADASILYAISSKKKGLKGLLVNGYGIYSDQLTDEMIKKLKTH